MARAKQSEFPLLDYLDELTEDLRHLIPRAVKGADDEAVHDARVATRRLKAATKLLAPVLSSRCRKPFDRVTRNLRRQLGPLRDLDVMLGHLDKLAAEKFDDAKAWLKTRLTECRAEALAEARKHAPPSRLLAKLGSWWGLREEILQAAEAIETVLAQSIHLQLDTFADRANSNAGDPHALRIAGKSLRYTLEMARHHRLRLPRSTLPTFKRMQDALGLWHDYVVLTERMLCESVDCDLVLHDPQLQGKILGLAQITLRKAQRQLKRMIDLWAARGQELCLQIREAFPLTKQVNQTSVEISQPSTPVNEAANPAA